MKVFRGSGVSAQQADSKSFVGSARTKRLAEAQAGTPVVVYRVEFEPEARTNWHTHSGAQWLLVVEGCVRVQQWGLPPQEAEAGDAVMIAPDEKHWHGAAPGARGVHLAVNVQAETQWLEPVTDDQYNEPLEPL
jgi:quercetin dioxygenase-like cupin family protein